jgi:hypothetical protein
VHPADQPHILHGYKKQRPEFVLLKNIH